MLSEIVLKKKLCPHRKKKNRVHEMADLQRKMNSNKVTFQKKKNTATLLLLKCMKYEHK